MTKITNSKRKGDLEIRSSGFGHCNFEFVIYLLFGAWDLGFPQLIAPKKQIKILTTQFYIFIAALTTSIVSQAILRARLLPSTIISSTISGRAS